MLKHFAVETAKLDNMTPYNDEETNPPTDRQMSADARKQQPP